MTKAKFKTYSRQQIPLLPATYEDKIPASHPVRVVDAVVEKIDLRKLYSTYKGGGTSSHNPKMLLKAIIYAYIANTYSSRKIEEAIKSDVRFIWLCGNCEPDHNTINRIRSAQGYF
jgi:transposase